MSRKLSSIIEQFHYICKRAGVQTSSSHLSTLEFLVIELYDKKKTSHFWNSIQLTNLQRCSVKSMGAKKLFPKFSLPAKSFIFKQHSFHLYQNASQFHTNSSKFCVLRKRKIINSWVPLLFSILPIHRNKVL
jgi:hypothetical protein